jgi:hypothetical protein
MTPNTTQQRRAAGTPAGGQFAPAGHREAAVQLGGPSAPHAGTPEPPPAGDPEHTAPTGTLTGVDPAARAALLDETAPTVTDPEGRYPVVTGPKYDRDRWRTSAGVARLLRADLKAAQQSAALPPTAVFSVRSETFAGGQSVRVEIRNLPDREILDDHPDYPNRPSRAALELERTVRRMANAYNRDASDRQSDVYDVNYLALVSVETESGRRTRQRLADQGHRCGSGGVVSPGSAAGISAHTAETADAID